MTVKRVNSIQDVIDDLRKLTTELKAIKDEALVRVLTERIEPQSKKECPKLTSTLVRSWTTNGPIHSGKRTKVEFGYGGNAKLYALKQHEITWYKHAKAGQKAKFLQQPVMDNIDEYPKRIIAGIDRILGVS